MSSLSLTRFPGSISGLLQVASLLSLLLLLFKAAQFLLRRQWLLKALQQFPSPPSHWFFGHKVGRNGRGVGGKGDCSPKTGQEVHRTKPVAGRTKPVACSRHLRNTQINSQAWPLPAPGAHSFKRSLSCCYSPLSLTLSHADLISVLAAWHLRGLLFVLPESFLLKAKHT